MSDRDRTDPDAYRSRQFVMDHRLETNTAGKRRESYSVNIIEGSREKGYESHQFGVYDSPVDVARVLATSLLDQSAGRFTYDDVSLTVLGLFPHLTTPNIFSAFLSTSPSLSVNRGASSIRAFGGERDALERIASQTLESVRRTLTPERFDAIAAEQTSIVHHNLFPNRPIAATRP